ncbi:MAG: hypothetical protein DMF10_10995 [Verrucomicrobia bacterium]|nr:MAG: hypothetical protein DMF10_10995 [Verrucomicrobiota bacterium]
MMLDDQGMTEEWIVRVQGKEYGPADIDTLREWKQEGRLLPENEARPASADPTAVAGSAKEVLWSTAAAIPGLFDVAALATASAGPLAQPPLQVQHRSFGQILAETFQIYRKGFFQFLGLTLLVLLPSICSQLTTALMQTPKGSDGDLRVLAGGAFAFLMFVLSIAMWPVYVAGIQILTAEISDGRQPRLIAMLNDAVRFWPRVAALCIFVYGVFALLMVFGLIIAVIALAGGSSLVLVLFALALLILQVWMFGRFFVNVLFWQQFAVLENAAFIDALRESRNLARSGRDLPWFQRPLWRGAFIASLWLAFVLAVTLISEWPILHHYLNQFATTQDAQTLLQQLTEAQQARGFDISAFVPNVLQKILQPLVGIAFVVLYLGSKIRLQ